MFPFLQNNNSGGGADIDIMGIGMALLSKDRQKIAEAIMPLITPERIAEIGKSIVEYFNEQQAKQGSNVKLRIAITGNVDASDVVIMVYRFEDGNKGEPIFSKNVKELTDTDIKPIIDAVLSAIFPTQP